MKHKTNFDQKTTLALIIAAIGTAAATPALAQSTESGSYTFFGTADVNVAVRNSGFGSKSSIGSGGMTASAVGVKGERNLGDGIKVIGTAEAGLAYDNGTTGNGASPSGQNSTTPSSGGLLGTGPQLMSRQAFVGITGGFGSVTIGRQYTGSYIQAAVFSNSLGAGFFGSSAVFLPAIGGMPTRVNNSIVYQSPTFANFRAHLTYTVGSENNTSGNTTSGATTITDRSGQGWDAALFHSNGPLMVGVSMWDVYNNSFVTATETELAKKTGAQLVASYDLKAVKLYATYVTGKIDGGNYENATQTLSKANGTSVSVAAPFGKHTIFASYSKLDDKSAQNKDGTLVGIAYTYALDAKTTLYANWGELSNNVNASYVLADASDFNQSVRTVGDDPRGIMAGLNVKF